jgi:hypothetical protein
MSTSSTVAAQSDGFSFAANTEPMAQARLKALPQSAQNKYERLRRVALRARAFADGIYEETARVRELRGDAQLELGRFDRQHRPDAAFTYVEGPDGTRKRVAAQFPQRDAIVARIDAATAELKRLQDYQAAASTGFNFSDLDAWLVDQPTSARFVDARALPKLAKGDTVALALERNREAQARVANDLTRVRNAPRTVAEAKALMRQQVSALADLGKPNIADLFRGGVVRWPTEQFVARGYGAPNVALAATVPNAAGLVVWANRSAIVAALEAEIARQGNDKDALSAADQAARIAECEATLLRLRREAEALIEQLEGDAAIVRRTCVDPLVLLGIERVR